MRRAAVLTLMLVAAGAPAAAQVVTSITPDATEGTSVSRAGLVTTIDGGTRAGGNLFHSFADFSLGAGETARWTASNPATVSNVVNRVTGGAVSNIAGAIDTTALPNANFFFLNPAGVVFTTGARIDVPGAVYVSTAASLRFADGQRFSAVTPGGSTFSVAAPESFGFVGGEGNVIVSGVAQTFARLDARLSLTAANIGVQSSTLTPSSLDLVTTGSRAATVTLADPLAGAPLAGLTVLNNANLFATAPGGGAPSVRVATGSFSQSGGALTSSSFFSGAAGDLVLRAQTADIGGLVASDVGENVTLGNGGTVSITVGNLHVGGGGAVSSSTFGGGAAGNLVITAGDMVVEGSGNIGSDSAGARASGRAGIVQINATSLIVRNGAVISSTTNNQGDAGSVLIKAGSVLLDGGYIDSVTLGGVGDAGSVAINANRLDIRGDLGGVGSFTSGAGRAGQVQITAKDITIQSGGNIGSASLARTGAAGDAGDISISATNLSVHDGFITSDSVGSGRAGIVAIKAASLTLDDTVISSAAHGAGDAGDVSLTATTLSVTNDSAISSSTFGAGLGGQVLITADKASLDFSQVKSRAEAGSTGRAGTVQIKAGQLAITNQTDISSATLGAGGGGLVSIVAKGLILSGGSDIVSATAGSGDGGQVVIAADTFSLDASLVSSTTAGAGNAGGVSISAKLLNLANVSSTESGAALGSTGNGGKVDIKADSLTAASASFIGTSTLASGDAGDLHIAAGEVVVDHALLASRAAQGATGQARNIEIETGSLSLVNDGQIATSSANPKAAGAITIVSTGPVSIRGDNAHISSANVSERGGAAGSISLRAGQILVADSGYISTDSLAGAAGDISLLLPETGILRVEGREASGVITTSSGPGTGGRITISGPLAVIANGGEILALGELRGANVLLNSQFFIHSTDRVNRLAVDGTLVVDSQTGDVSAGVARRELPFVDASGVLRGQCRSSRQEGVVSELTTRAVGPYAANATSGTAAGPTSCR